ncbi:Asp/Glu racemase [Streptomyces pratensis]|uniref:aspartate racemase/maleate isomerase family protein n=1 Tax=Streptomyces pratensis TaxID=1169025 RepID=UPI0037B3F90E
MTYTDEVPYRDNLQLVSRLGKADLLAEPVQELVECGAEAVAYLCTACSIVDGVAGERALREAMLAYGAQRALTTSGAVTDALRAVGARRLAVVHPYQEPVDRLLAAYLSASGFDVAALTGLGLAAVEDVYAVEEQQVMDAVIRGDDRRADAVFISCTTLPTYDALPRLEERLGKPVISANQATAWALLDAVGEPAHGPHQ